MGPTNDYETHVQTALAQVPRPWPSRRTLHGSFDAGWYQHSLSSCKIDCFTVLSSHLICRPYGGMPVLVPAGVISRGYQWWRREMSVVFSGCPNSRLAISRPLGERSAFLARPRSGRPSDEVARGPAPY